jgi:chromosome segregation ATPase
MLKRKGSSSKRKEPNPSKVQASGETSEGADRWYEFVRTLRTYYDHLRVAFPHLEEIPKYYSEAWGEGFRSNARKFVVTEDMSSVRKVLVGAGYGTPKWDRFVERTPEEVGQAIDYLLENEGLIAKGAVAREESAGKAPDQGAKDPDGGGKAVSAREEVNEDPFEEIVEPVIETGESSIEDAASEQELDESLAVDLAAIQALMEALGEDLWNQLLSDPEGATAALAQAGQSGPPIEDGDSEQDEQGRGLKFLEDKYAALETEHMSQKQRFEEAKKEVRELQGQLDDEKRKNKALEDQIRRTEEEVEKKQKERDQAAKAGKAQAPSEMASRLQEYEQTLLNNEKIIETLREQSAADRQQCEEFKESLQREKKARHQFEAELNAERQELREQIKRMGDVLAGGEEIPSIEEFEQMEAEELLGYIEDVDKEKQRALAGLEAMDVQEESYQKQLKVQQVEMDTIQDDLEKFKGSNLATEVEDMNATVQKQRSQLETLMGFSKNLKSQNQHLKERQDPLRKLVDRLNMQEKALVRYVRINYDKNFIPHQAYHAQQGQ